MRCKILFSHVKLKKIVFPLSLIILMIGVLPVRSETADLDSDPIIYFYYNNVKDEQVILEDTNIVNLTFYLISDLHGWIEPHDGFGGAATLMGHFVQDGYSSDNDSFLIFSGGDHNTGPAEVTLSKGEAIIDIMNEMNFTAAAIGNHEFDYGFEVMELQKEQANFPLLASNIFDEGTTTVANFSVPYVIQEHAGIKLGIIGLTLDFLYAKADQDYDAGDYETSVRNNYDLAVADGADIVIVLGHIPPYRLGLLASNVADLGIELFLGGHGHYSGMDLVGNSLVVATEAYNRQYAKVVLSIDNTTKSIVAKEGELVFNYEGGATPVSSVQQVVDYWVSEINASEVLTYASTDVYDGTPESGIGNLVTDGFLDYFDWQYNFGITNRGGGYRDYFRAGDISLGDVVSVIPFENTLMELTMTGDDILQMLYDRHSQYTYSGISYRFYYDPGLVIHSVQIFENEGFYDLSLSKIYQGVMTDFNWWQNHYGLYAAVDTGIHYRDTVIEYFRTLDDIVSYSYDDRILETDEEIPGVREYSQIYYLLLSVPIIAIPVLLRRKIWNKH